MQTARMDGASGILRYCGLQDCRHQTSDSSVTKRGSKIRGPGRESSQILVRTSGGRRENCGNPSRGIGGKSVSTAWWLAFLWNHQSHHLGVSITFGLLVEGSLECLHESPGQALGILLLLLGDSGFLESIHLAELDGTASAGPLGFPQGQLRTRCVGVVLLLQRHFAHRRRLGSCCVT